MDYELRGKEMCEDWFKDHVAKYTIFKDPKGNEIESMTWYKPGTNCYRIRYLRLGRVLFITGDLGEAVHSWGSDAPMSFIAGCNLDYFAGKVAASENDRNPGASEWNKQEAIIGLKKHFKTNNYEEMWNAVFECDENPGDNPEKTEEFDKKFWEKGLDVDELELLSAPWERTTDISWSAAVEDGILGELNSEEEWGAWLSLNADYDAEKYLGEDLWEWAYTVGRVVSLRCQSHLIGLNMAWASVEKISKMYTGCDNSEKPPISDNWTC